MSWNDGKSGKLHTKLVCPQSPNFPVRLLRLSALVPLCYRQPSWMCQIYLILTTLRKIRGTVNSLIQYLLYRHPIKLKDTLSLKFSLFLANALTISLQWTLFSVVFHDPCLSSSNTSLSEVTSTLFHFNLLAGFSVYISR